MSRKKRLQKRPQFTAVQNFAEGVLLNSVIALFRLIPVDIASYLMGKTWRVLAPFNSRHKRALSHLEQAIPSMTTNEREKTVRDMWENLGRVAAETFHIDRLLKQNFRFEANADQATEEILKGNKACIFVSLHSANWELCVQPAVQNNLEIVGVYQALSNPKADEALRSLRKVLYKGGLLSKGHQTARKMMSTLKNGGIVAMMGDLREARGIQVPFFGRMAYVNTVPASLARSCGVPIVLGRVIRKDGVHFCIEGRAITVPVTDDRKKDIEAATVEIHSIFQNWIEELPGQWMWIHRKWAPPGKNAADKHARRASQKIDTNTPI